MTDPLTAVRRTTTSRRTANARWRASIVEAKQAGKSLREIAEVAGVNHVRVLQIVNEENGTGRRPTMPR